MRVVPEVVWVVERAIGVVLGADDSFWELFRLPREMHGPRDLVHRAKNASIHFSTRRVVFCQVARGRVD